MARLEDHLKTLERALQEGKTAVASIGELFALVRPHMERAVSGDVCPDETEAVTPSVDAGNKVDALGLDRVRGGGECEDVVADTSSQQGPRWRRPPLTSRALDELWRAHHWIEGGR